MVCGETAGKGNKLQNCIRVGCSLFSFALACHSKRLHGDEDDHHSWHVQLSESGLDNVTFPSEVSKQRALPAPPTFSANKVFVHAASNRPLSLPHALIILSLAFSSEWPTSKYTGPASPPSTTTGSIMHQNLHESV